MVRAQADHRPAIPHSFEDLDNVLQANFDLRNTLDGEALLYQGVTGGVGHRSLVFASERVLEGIGPVSYLFGNATLFSTQQSGFIPTLHISINEGQPCKYAVCNFLYFVI